MGSSAGYSSTPLAQKLGLKDGQRVLFINLPVAQLELTRSRDFAEVKVIGQAAFGDDRRDYDVIHLFTAARTVLETLARPMMDAIARNGMIWISWPKKAAKIATDMTEDVIRTVILPLGLVDVKVCAVDDVWSGLKLMIRKEPAMKTGRWSIVAPGCLVASFLVYPVLAAAPSAAQKTEFHSVCMGIAHDETLCSCKAEATPRLIDSDFMSVVIASMKGKSLDPKYAVAYNTYVAKSNQICKPNY
ncbi:hypothetical protein PSQ19_13005 [Devosia algicola]|uniref:DUF3052 domain-containing protein n=1 Tax=Devosia algicola TaxID=3026418 RepID=A0ABY7YKH1_9HYPH|nr:hypothetical protein [Devosia algicola]WDR01663.1 hypothetical protein PSQ19_13005 [Devosia algicola]